MNKKIRSYVSAMRLRTIPLSLSGVLLGAMLAAADFHVDWKVVFLLALTAVMLQILSNLSNELGDFMRGTASGHGREASKALEDGEISMGGLQTMIKVQVAVVILSGLALLHVSFGSIFLLESFIMMILGYAAIRAAKKYTLGPEPYGYKGLGDLYVFLFFGLVAVMGSYYLCSHSFGTKLLFLPALAVGAFSMAVLNVNNLRDMETDRNMRMTIAIRLGERGAKIYQTLLIVVGWTAMTVYSCLRFFDPWHFLYVLTLPLFVWHIVGVWKNSGKSLDRYLPLLVMSTFAFSLLAGVGYLVFLIK